MKILKLFILGTFIGINLSSNAQIESIESSTDKGFYLGTNIAFSQLQTGEVTSYKPQFGLGMSYFYPLNSLTVFSLGGFLSFQKLDQNQRVTERVGNKIYVRNSKLKSSICLEVPILLERKVRPRTHLGLGYQVTFPIVNLRIVESVGSTQAQTPELSLKGSVPTFLLNARFTLSEQSQVVLRYAYSYGNILQGELETFRQSFIFQIQRRIAP